MPAFNLIFENPINESVQIGDIAYYAPTNGIDIFDVSSMSGVIELGEIIEISNTNPYIIVVEYPLGTFTSTPVSNGFIMFSKNNAVNTSSLLGYYMDVKLINTSTSKIELFSIGSEISESSK